MRNLDNHDQFFDNEGNFLHGKIVFCRKGTSTAEGVFAWDSEHNEYVAIGNEVFLDANGRPEQQIYLGDVDYTGYVYKYIGSGDMSMDSAPESWTLQDSFNNLYDVFGLEIKTDSAYLCPDMATLETLDPDNVGEVDGAKLVMLGGYYDTGDCPPVYYRWDAESTATANGVNVVAVTDISVGRWILVNDFTENGFDVRHAGAFPTKAADQTSVTQSYAIQKADTYAITAGVALVFPSVFPDAKSYYRLNNLIVNSPCLFADGVRLVTTTSAEISKVDSRNASKSEGFVFHDGTFNGEWTLGGEIIRTSFLINEEEDEDTNWPPSLEPTKRLVYDKALGCNEGPATLELSDVEVEVAILLQEDILDLTRCVIYSVGKIRKASYFDTCEISGTFFDSQANINNMTFTNCVSSLDSWASVDDFVWYAKNNGETELDLQGKTCLIDFYNNGNVRTFPFKKVYNAVFEGEILLPRSNGGIDLDGFELVNCNVQALGLDRVDGSLDELRLIDSKAAIVRHNGYNVMPNAKLVLRGSEITGDLLDCGSVDVDGSVIDNFEITTSEQNGVEGRILNSRIKAAITFVTNTTYEIVVDGNVFSDGGEIRLVGVGTDKTFKASSFCNNVITDGPREFITYNNAHFDLVNFGSYKYANNQGAERNEKAKLALILPFYAYDESVPDNVKKYIKRTGASPAGALLHGFTIENTLFSFGENTKKCVYASVGSGYYSGLGTGSVNFISAANTKANNNYFNGAIPIVYSAGTPASREIYGTNISSALLSFENVPYGGQVYIELNVEYIESNFT